VVWRRLPVLHYLTLGRWPGGQRAGNASPCGPASYSASFGDETAVVRIHSGNGPHEEMDHRAVACFDQALVDVGLAGNDRLRELLHDYFAWATRTAMSRYHRSADDVPDDLRIPHWSWDGLIRESRPAER
jgi:hemoglobin